MQSTDFLYPKAPFVEVTVDGRQGCHDDGRLFAHVDVMSWGPPSAEDVKAFRKGHIGTILTVYAETPEQLERLAEVATLTARQLRIIGQARIPQQAAVRFQKVQCVVCGKPVKFTIPEHERNPYCGDCDQAVRDRATEREAEEVALTEEAERQMEQRQSEHERADADGEVEAAPHAEDAHADSAPHG